MIHSLHIVVKSITGEYYVKPITYVISKSEEIIHTDTCDNCLQLALSKIANIVVTENQPHRAPKCD